MNNDLYNISLSNIILEYLIKLNGEYMAFLKKGDDSGCKILSIIKTEDLDEDAKTAIKDKLNAEQNKDAKKLEKQ